MTRVAPKAARWLDLYRHLAPLFNRPGGNLIFWMITGTAAWMAFIKVACYWP